MRQVTNSDQDGAESALDRKLFRPKNDTMKIAMFSKIPVAPAHGGNRSRILNLVTALERLGVELSFYLVPSQQMRDIDIAEHERVFGNGNFHIIKRTAFGALAFNTRIAAKILKRKAGKIIPALRASRSSNVDYVFPQFAITGIPDRKSLNTLDAIIIQYVHFSKILDTVPDSVYKIIDTHDSFHKEFTDEAEASGLARAHRVLAIQEEESSRFGQILTKVPAKRPARTNVQVVSHFLDLSDQVSLDRAEGATFFGSSFEANIISIRYFLDQVFPLILQEMPNFKFHVAGSICNDIPELASVVKLGRVNTVGDAYKDAPILVNAIRAGTGIKIKLLEAMGLGVPAVSTVLGVQSIPQEFLKGTVVVDDADPRAFAKAIVKLVQDGDARKRLGRQARACAESWNITQTDRLAALIEEIKAHRSSASS